MPRKFAAVQSGAGDVAVEVRGIHKSFAGTAVLRDVDFLLRWGEVHALLGENGAGKSTLMNILTGIYSADHGSIRIAGQQVALTSPAKALGLGIGMVHQHFRLVMPFTGRENIYLAADTNPELKRNAACDERISAVMQSSGLHAPLDSPIYRLAVADRQRVEILKALVLGARILILDEPTAVLTDAEAERLLLAMRDLSAQGYCIIFITHKLREVLAAGDRVSTLRNGVVTLLDHAVRDVTAHSLSESMLGSQPVAAQPVAAQPDAAQPDAAPIYARRTLGAARLALNDVSLAGETIAQIGPINLTVRAGEIVGVAGIGGNGQQELAEVIMGLRAASGGQLEIDAIEATGQSVAQRRDLGLRFIPSDRARLALAANASLNENLAATAVRTGKFGRMLLWPAQINAYANELIAAFAISGARGSGTRPIRLLSGGNAQKAVLARELDADAAMIVAHSPTRGLDIAACRYVHDRLVSAAESGAAVLLISEDLEEIMALADRIVVMSRGAMATAAGDRPSREQIGALLLGHV